MEYLIYYIKVGGRTCCCKNVSYKCICNKQLINNERKLYYYDIIKKNNIVTTSYIRKMIKKEYINFSKNEKYNTKYENIFNEIKNVFNGIYICNLDYDREYLDELIDMKIEELEEEGQRYNYRQLENENKIKESNILEGDCKKDIEIKFNKFLEKKKNKNYNIIDKKIKIKKDRNEKIKCFCCDKFILKRELNNHNKTKIHIKNTKINQQ